jgi:hypothetical protein
MVGQMEYSMDNMMALTLAEMKVLKKEHLWAEKRDILKDYMMERHSVV